MSELQDKVVVLAAGGRIVQKLPDQSELSDEEISAFIPDFLRPMSVFRKWSFQPVSNYTLNMCADIVHMAKSMIHDEKAKAIVITCAVHAMAELAYFSDLIWDLNSPLIFTASIFSSNSPNSETRTRLTQSVTAALSQSTSGKGTLICLNDALYSPADIIRISNYRRADLQMFSPLGIYTQPGGDYIHLRNPRTRNFRTLTSPIPRNLPILTAALGSDDLVIRTLAEKADTLDGLILSGLGDGDVPSSWIPHIRKIIKTNIPIVLTSRYPGGYVQAMEQYEGSASQLIDMGAIPAGLLSPFHARLRLAVALASGMPAEELPNWIRG